MKNTKCNPCPYKGKYKCEASGRWLTEWFACPQDKIRKSLRKETKEMFEHSIDPDKDFARWDEWCEKENARIRAQQEQEDEDE